MVHVLSRAGVLYSACIFASRIPAHSRETTTVFPLLSGADPLFLSALTVLVTCRLKLDMGYGRRKRCVWQLCCVRLVLKHV